MRYVKYRVYRSRLSFVDAAAQNEPVLPVYCVPGRSILAIMLFKNFIFSR